MSRYIDADALRKELIELKDQAEKRLDGVEEGNIACRLIYTTQLNERDNLLSLVNWMPTADVAEVVRCRDCKHTQILNNGTIICLMNSALWSVEEEHFCSYGERRAEE